MKTWKIATVLTLAVIGVALVTASAFAFNGFRTTANYGYPAGTTYPPTTNPTQTYRGWGWGCMGRWRWGNAAPTYPSAGITATPITIDTAATIAQQYLSQLNNPDLAVREVEEYTQNFYVQVYEKNTGIGAVELLIDKYTGRIYPEMGPNMIWNTKYGMHSGMMGWFTGNPATPMTVTAEQAETNAQQWLNANLPGTTVDEAEPFCGYYHVMVLSAGKGYGMLSVNGYTGHVWYHTWHGTFIQELEL